MIKKILLGLLVLLIVVVGGFVIFVQTSWNKTYDIAYPTLETSTDSAVIAHGKYLVHGAAHCSGCHVGDFSDMITYEETGAEMPLKGGARIPLGPLGTIIAANLTPDEETGIGRYSDGEVFRMMRHAVKPDGTASLALMMPFWNMADDDMIAVVSYLRSQEPVRNDVGPAEWTFMGKAIRTMAPLFEPIYEPTPPSKAPPMEASLERGEYLARYVANCVGCHTPRNPETFDPIGPEFSGGMDMEPLPELHIELGVDPDLWTRSVNLTPHPNSALSRFKTAEEWIDRFRQKRVIMHSPMDWGSFSRMTDEDLESLWLYLNSLEPVENDITEIVFKKG